MPQIYVIFVAYTTLTRFSTALTHILFTLRIMFLKFLNFYKINNGEMRRILRNFAELLQKITQ